MAIIGDALRQAFMPKQEYESLREEERAWIKLQRPVLTSIVAFLCFVIFTCTVVSLRIVFPSNVLRRPFCSDVKVQPLPVYGKARDSDLFPGAFYLTDQETVDFYWMVVFVPSTVVFLVSSVYLVAGERLFVLYLKSLRLLSHWFYSIMCNAYGRYLLTFLANGLVKQCCRGLVDVSSKPECLLFGFELWRHVLLAQFCWGLVGKAFRKVGIHYFGKSGLRKLRQVLGYAWFFHMEALLSSNSLSFFEGSCFSVEW